MIDDPCDEWPLIIWRGRVCRIVHRENGVSPMHTPELVSWRYEVVEGWIPYGVFNCVYAEEFA